MDAIEGGSDVAAAEKLVGQILEDLAACGRSLREPPIQVVREKETKVQTPDAWKKLYGQEPTLPEVLRGLRQEFQELVGELGIGP